MRTQLGCIFGSILDNRTTPHFALDLEQPSTALLLAVVKISTGTNVVVRKLVRNGLSRQENFAAATDASFPRLIRSISRKLLRV